MADVLDRVKKLMELALHNPNEQEARTAAMAAVRLIDQHKIELRAKAAPKPPINPYDSLKDLVRQAQEQVERDLATIRVKQPNAYSPPHECRFHYDILAARHTCTICGKTHTETDWWASRMRP